MKLFTNQKIGVRLNIVFSILVVLVVASLGIFSYFNSKGRIIDNTDQRMNEQLVDLEDLIELQLFKSEEQLGHAINTAKTMLGNRKIELSSQETTSLNATNHLTGATQQIQLPTLMIDSVAVYRNNDFVDRVKANAGGTSTVLQKFEDGYVSISSNVMLPNGERAIGTYIPMSDEIAQTISAGNRFQGRAFIIDQYYFTIYDPIKIDGEVVGMLFVGIPEKDMGYLKGIFASKVFYENG
ncbi:MAG TPA: Cache 3/Cache 2 fusion domain-containing protein, partial [Bacteroidales bacterium]|nr:Cache 3/Cache 2 fusion domain-containing protein [Bacteroidales bacterium]